MSIEETLDRIATAVERIAAYLGAAKSDTAGKASTKGAGTAADTSNKTSVSGKSSSASQVKEDDGLDGDDTDTKVSFETMREKLVAIKNSENPKLGKEQSSKIMAKFGGKLQDIKEKDYAAVVAACDALTDKHGE